MNNEIYDDELDYDAELADLYADLERIEKLFDDETYDWSLFDG